METFLFGGKLCDPVHVLSGRQTADEAKASGEVLPSRFYLFPAVITISEENSDGQVKCKVTGPDLNTSLPVFGCVVTPVPRCRPRLCRFVRLCLSAVLRAVQRGSALFEKREKSPVPVGDALSSSGGLAVVSTC